MNQKKMWRITTFVASVIASVISIVVFTVAQSALLSYPSEGYQIELSHRIEIVSEHLRDASRELNAIQLELEQRIALVERLNEEATHAEAMIDLTQEQVDAIRAALNIELNRNVRFNFWIAFAQNFLFVILGSVITIVIPKLLHKFKGK